MRKLEKINDDLTIYSDTEHLKYGTDALLLAGYLKKGTHAAELGAGNGVVSLLALARGKFQTAELWELQSSVAELAHENILLNKMEDRAVLHVADLRNIGASLTGTFDCVFSNPPYMKVDAGKGCLSSEKQIARHETAGDIFDFCRVASKLLRYGGEAVFVYRPDRLCDLMMAMRENGIEPKRMTFVSSDTEHAPGMVLVAGKKGGNSGLVLTPHFFISDPNGSKTKEYEYLMKEGCFDERYRNP